MSSSKSNNPTVKHDSAAAASSNVTSACTGVNIKSATENLDASVSYEYHNENQTFVQTTHKHLIEKVSDEENNESDESASSDEDILHVVTNVYTIPIIGKSVSAGNGPFILDTSSASEQQGGFHASTSVDEVVLNQQRQYYSSSHEHQHTSSTSIPFNEPHVEVKRTVVKKVLEQSTSSDAKPVATSQVGHDLTKSKFQIRSIVEIYENPSDSTEGKQQQQQQSGDVGFFKTSTQYNELTTKEVIGQPLNKGKLVRFENPTTYLSMLPHSPTPLANIYHFKKKC
jgi:hypothetical protein